MRVALAGANGYMGSHILMELQEHGHEVVALVRNENEATTVSDEGATPRIVGLYDRPAVVKLFHDADGAINVAIPRDETSANLIGRRSILPSRHSRPMGSPGCPNSPCRPTGALIDKPISKEKG